MRDRFLNGFMAGSIAGIIATGVNLFTTEIIQFGSLRYLDFAGIFVYGRRPINLAEDLFAGIGYITFVGLLGILFAYLVANVGSRYLIWKGIIYGVSSWFIIYAITLLFDVPTLGYIDLESSISNFIASLVYGIILGFIFHKFQTHELV